MRSILAMVVAAGALAGAGTAPEEKTGLKEGAKAPAFALKDQDGKERTLDELKKGDGLLAIVFHRSAEW